MSNFLDFAEIKASFPIEDVVQRLELNVNKSQKSWRGKCPTCESSGDRNLSISTDRNVFYCLTDCKGGDQLQLVAHVKGITVKEAAEWLQGPASPTKGNSKEKTAKGEAPSEGGFKPLDYLVHDHEAVLALGISPEDAERIGCGYAPRGMMKGTIAWPIRSTSGKLLGYIGAVDVKLPSQWRY